MAQAGFTRQLVQQMYSQSSPQDIARIQSTLQSVQRTFRAWALADELLKSSDAQVRFFGALTFTLKIKLDWQVTISRRERLHSLLRTGPCFSVPDLRPKMIAN